MEAPEQAVSANGKTPQTQFATSALEIVSNRADSYNGKMYNFIRKWAGRLLHRHRNVWFLRAIEAVAP